MTYRFGLLAIALIVLSACAADSTFATDDGTSAATRVEALIRERLAASAKADKTAWRAHISDDCVWVGPGLQVGTTEDAQAEQIGSSETRELKDFTAREFGDIVIATYLFVATSEVNGTKNLRRWRKSDTYQRTADDWHMISAVEIVIPTRPIAKVDPAVYDDYAGTYRLNPDVALRVWRDADRLIMQASGQAEGETFPAGDDIFFDDGEPGDYVFLRDRSRHVIAIVYRNQGTELRLDREN